MTLTPKQFKDVAQTYRPRLRYWWPGGYVANDLEELDREIKAISDAGFGGIEIADVYDAISPEDCQVLNPKEYGFASTNWKKAVRQALFSAKQYGITVDLTVGPHWPASTNEATPNDPGTAKELVYGTYAFSGVLPTGTNVSELCQPHYKTKESMIDGSAIDNKLIAIYVAEHTGHDEVEMPAPVPWEKPYTVIKDNIVFDSLKEITPLFENGQLGQDLSVTNDSLLIAVYQRGTGQRVNMFSMGSPNRPDVMDPYAYVVDHFSPVGADLIQSLWNNQILDDELRYLLREVGDCLFEDSLELTSVGHWTDNMLTEFETRAGYSIRPYLPFILGINQDKGVGADKASFQVAPADMAKVETFRHDYYRVLNELYQDYHLAPLRNFAHSLGLKYRSQPYGWAIDSADAGSRMDIVEGESLGFGEDGNDAFRILAAGRDFGGLEILSDEAGAYLFQAYATTLPQLLATLHKNEMAGVNQTYWHGMPYKYAPGAKWPSASAFSPMLGGRGFAEPWSPSQPVWQQLPTYTTYLARVHQVLRYGKNQVDVLVYTDGHNASENKVLPIGSDLTKLGYSYQVATEGLMLKEVAVNSGHLLVKGGTYRALYVPEDIALPQDVSERIAELRAAGLAVVSTLTDLQTALGSSLLAEPSGDLLHYRRMSEDQDFLLVYNQGQTELDLTAVLAEDSYEEWDAWAGEINAVTRTSLNAGELRIFCVNPDATPSQASSEKWISIADQAWTVTLDSWSMVDPDVLEIKHDIYQLEQESLQPWSACAGFEERSGIATYRTSIPSVTALLLPQVNDAMTVKVNGQIVAGNPLTGRYDIATSANQGQNVLEITLASTLNNYINGSPLADYYSIFKPQTYGLSEAYIALSK